MINGSAHVGNIINLNFSDQPLIGSLSVFSAHSSFALCKSFERETLGNPWVVLRKLLHIHVMRPRHRPSYLLGFRVSS